MELLYQISLLSQLSSKKRRQCMIFLARHLHHLGLLAVCVCSIPSIFPTRPFHFSFHQILNFLSHKLPLMDCSTGNYISPLQMVCRSCPSPVSMGTRKNHILQWVLIDKFRRNYRPNHFSSIYGINDLLIGGYFLHSHHQPNCRILLWGIS